MKIPGPGFRHEVLIRVNRQKPGQGKDSQPTDCQLQLPVFQHGYPVGQFRVHTRNENQGDAHQEKIHHHGGHHELNEAI